MIPFWTRSRRPASAAVPTEPRPLLWSVRMRAGDRRPVPMPDYPTACHVAAAIAAARMPWYTGAYADPWRGTVTGHATGLAGREAQLLLVAFGPDRVKLSPQDDAGKPAFLAVGTVAATMWHSREAPYRLGRVGDLDSVQIVHDPDLDPLAWKLINADGTLRSSGTITI